MRARIAWLAAAEKRPVEEFQGPLGRKPPRREEDPQSGRPRDEPRREAGAREEELGKAVALPIAAQPGVVPQVDEAARGEWLETLTYDPESERRKRVYRGRTIGMLRRYLQYSIETGRLPSLLGREFFRAKVTSYTVVTFEDRVIFAHDMEICLERLDEFSRQLIARHVLQEHDQAETGRLLGCAERTVRTYAPIALDLLSEILLDVGLLERIDATSRNPCQGGLEADFSVSACEDDKNKI